MASSITRGPCRSSDTDHSSMRMPQPLAARERRQRGPLCADLRIACRCCRRTQCPAPRTTPAWPFSRELAGRRRSTASCTARCEGTSRQSARPPAAQRTARRTGRAGAENTRDDNLRKTTGDLARASPQGGRTTAMRATLAPFGKANSTSDADASSNVTNGSGLHL